MGGNIAYEKNKLKIGVTGIYYFFDRAYEPDLKKYAQYNLHGNHFYNVGVDYKYRLGRFSWVGEVAMGKKGFALLNELKYHLSSDYRLLIIGAFSATLSKKAVLRKRKMVGTWQQKLLLGVIGSFLLPWIYFLSLGGSTASVSRQKA